MRAVGRGPNLPSQVAQVIANDIREGRFQPADRLPTERELVDTFGVSRNVVREAIARLRSEGLVETRQGAGVYVARPLVQPTLRMDRDILRDRASFAKLFEVRAILEIEAAGLAATRRGRRDLATIAETLRQLQQSQVPPGSVAADLDFHRAVAAASDNMYVVTFIGFVSDHVRDTIALADRGLDAETRARVNAAEHEAIYEAIRDRDAARARDSMRQHLHNAMLRLGLEPGR
jgi:GntR family transcriptional regulator, transcriptional repressor for pyruvate dehydrogenase complex